MKLTNRQKEIVASKIQKSLEKDFPEFNQSAFDEKLDRLESLQLQLFSLKQEIVEQLKIDNPQYNYIMLYNTSNTNSFHVSKSKTTPTQRVILDEIEMASIDGTDVDTLIETLINKFKNESN